MRICPVCGKEVRSGMTTDMFDFYVHEKCFREYMDNEYGKENWKCYEDDKDWNGEHDASGGYYIVRDSDSDEWFQTGIYYTEFDDYSYFEEGECL